MDEHLGHLAEAYRSGRVGRRSFIRWAATLGLSAPAISAVLAACSPASPTGPTSAPTSAGAGAPAAAGSTPAVGQPKRGGTMRVTGSPAVEINPHKLTSNGGIITVFPCLNFLV